MSLGSLGWLLVGVGGTVLFAKHSSDSLQPESPNLAVNATVVAGSDTAPQKAPTAEQAIGALTVRNIRGAVVPLVTKGEPAIIMISSVTCSWCKRTLKDLGELSAGRPLPRLKLLTLEGAAGGVPMVSKERITGAQLIGPIGGNDQVLMTFRFRGTPTFVAIDRNGRVVATMPGYPMREVLKTWYAVMVGDSDLP
ncbi:MAG: hypothetical protein IPP90_11670 [Gemmatimonadaceae bacterium]|nr:hypothetical protein [Gemmatimonadaceae bacterium]